MDSSLIAPVPVPAAWSSVDVEVIDLLEAVISGKAKAEEVAAALKSTADKVIPLSSHECWLLLSFLVLVLPRCH